MDGVSISAYSRSLVAPALSASSYMTTRVRLIASLCNPRYTLRSTSNNLPLSLSHCMTIVLADTDIHFRDRLKRRLEKITGVNVVGESSDAKEATAMILNRKPDIAILDSSLQDGRAIEVLRQIKRLMVPPTIIVVTNDPSPDKKTAYSLAGADFFFEKTTEEHMMINAVRCLSTSQSRIESSAFCHPN